MTDPSKKDLTSSRELGFTPYFTIETVGQRIGLVSCIQCGAAVIVGDKDFNAARAHAAWHANRQV